MVVNAAISLAVARGGPGHDPRPSPSGRVVVLNVVLVLLAAWCSVPAGQLHLGDALFFVVCSAFTLLDDRYRPVQVARLAEAGRPHAAPST